MITWTEFAIARKASQLIGTGAERPLTPIESRTLNACWSFTDLLKLRESLPDDAGLRAARRAPPRQRKGSMPRTKKMVAYSS